MLLELASGLTPSLDQEAISLLYRSTKPLVLDDSSPQVQKRAYKVRYGCWSAQQLILLTRSGPSHKLLRYTRVSGHGN